MTLLTREKIMNELYDSVDYNNLKFEHKDVSFYGCKNSKKFNAIQSSRINVSEVKNEQNEFLNKLSNIKFDEQMMNNKKWLIILIIFTN